MATPSSSLGIVLTGVVLDPSCEDWSACWGVSELFMTSHRPTWMQVICTGLRMPSCTACTFADDFVVSFALLAIALGKTLE